MASPSRAPTGPPREFVARSRVLALIVTAGSVALVAIILALPFTMQHALEGAQLLLWAALLLIVSLIAGISLVYAYVTRLPSSSHAESPPTSGEEVPASREQLTLQLLPEDERALYRRILHEGGELLQKDLQGMLSFSGPKISRLLDRLEGKGLVVRERHGMTNRVRLRREE